MPVALQRLMVEKSFVQFPQSGRHRQEFYFWDTLCALVCRTTESGPRRNWLGTEVPDDGDLMPTARHVEKLDDYVIKNRDVSTIRSTRRAEDDEKPEIGISAARAARLRRLGIDRNGEVVCEVRRPAMKEPEVNTVSNQVKDDPLITLPSSFDPPVGTFPNSTMKRLDDVRVDDVIPEDPDDEMISSRNAYASHRRHRGKRSHTLLPPNCEDAESIYSAEEEEADVRPRDRDVSPNGRRRRRRRHRKHTKSSQRRHEHRPKKSRRSPVSDEFERPTKSRRSPVPDEFDNLHGTVEPPPIPEKEFPLVPETVADNHPPKMEKKKRWQQLGTPLSRLKSFF
uniref:Uncharacterized protein n=2 Tax=Ciona intestinalis TaxID=7719 RepID=F6ZZI6_CIOIN